MQSLRPATWLAPSVVSSRLLSCIRHRNASLTSAIGRGVRKSKLGLDSAERRHIRSGHDELVTTSTDRPRPPPDKRSGNRRAVEELPRRQLYIDGGTESGPRAPREAASRTLRQNRDTLTVRNAGVFKGHGTPERRHQYTGPGKRSGFERARDRGAHARGSGESARFHDDDNSNKGSSSSLGPGEMVRRGRPQYGRHRTSYSGQESEVKSKDMRNYDEPFRRSREYDGTRRELQNQRREGQGHLEVYGQERPKIYNADHSAPAASIDLVSSARRSSVKVPVSIPYTTAGSEFLYGTFAVKAALQAGRRKTHVLYMYQGEGRDEDLVVDKGIEKLALAAGVKVKKVTGDWIRLMGKMSGGRPHNGYILETSAIPKLPATALQPVEEVATETFDVDVAAQSIEDAEVNRCFEITKGAASLRRVSNSRFPLILMLDRILDPGNLGAIIRSCYFLGVDALALIEHGSAPFSPVTIKASAGAAEFLPILNVKKDIEFIKASKQNGWTFVAAMAESGRPGHGPTRLHSDDLRQSPCVLLMGNEGEGLRPQLQRLADATASITNVRGSQHGIDSLNVSVAAALLAQRFLEARVSASLPVADGKVF